jgi:hypothetical protein
MVMMMNETRSGTPPDVLDEDDDLDGWGPVRPRRSSMPTTLAADSAHADSECIDDDACVTTPLKT